MTLLGNPAAERQAFNLVEMSRRLVNVVRLGTVHAVDRAAARVQVQYDEIPDGDPVLTAWLPWVTARAGETSTWWAPDVGEQVVLLAPSGELAQAVVLPALYRTLHPAPSAEADTHRTEYSDGAAIEYNATDHELTAVLPEGATASIEADGGIEIAGNVTVNGTLHATGKVSSDADVEDSVGTMASMRTTYNGHTHPHPQGPTGVPAQQM